ncbi:MAG: nonstructural protein [Microviridae sp.]|nr:MAG: nonstructural protein [Microviridae sp.]
MKKMFSVYDSKAQVFSNPFTSHNTFTALRDFQAAALDGNSQISQYPEDFVLFEIGHFEDETGVLSPCLPVNLGNADQFTSRS